MSGKRVRRTVSSRMAPVSEVQAAQELDPGPGEAGGIREMAVHQLTVDALTNMPVLILKDPCSDETLPINIGLNEAAAIAAEIEKIALDRPVAHDLLRQLISMVGLAVVCVELDDERSRHDAQGALYATIRLEGQGAGSLGKRLVLDARPSDAIALALRAGARICVTGALLSRRGVVPPPGATYDEAAGLRALLESLPDEEFGKWKM